MMHIPIFEPKNEDDILDSHFAVLFRHVIFVCIIVSFKSIIIFIMVFLFLWYYYGNFLYRRYVAQNLLKPLQGIFLHMVVRSPYPIIEGVQFTVAEIILGFILTGLPILYIVFVYLLVCFQRFYGAKVRQGKTGKRNEILLNVLGTVYRNAFQTPSRLVQELVSHCCLLRSLTSQEP